MKISNRRRKNDQIIKSRPQIIAWSSGFSWTSKLSADCILIASDAVMNDDLRKCQ